MQKIVRIKLQADTKAYKNEMRKASRSVNSFGKQLRKVAGMVAGAFAVRAVINFASSTVKAYDIQAKAEAELLTALKGRKVAQKDLIAQAQRLQKVTLFGDEETIHAQALIAAFVKEKNQIKEIIPLVQDFATAKKMNLAAAADLVSKTLGSSTNALTRYGISVTGAVGSNERLASVVRGMSDAFKGQARTAALAGAGGLKQLANEWGDVKEAIGGAIFKGIKPAINALKELLVPTQSVTEQFNLQAEKVNNLKKNISPLLDRYDSLKKKTHLSAGEQKEMNILIDQISKAIPTAITQFNKYGKAIDISTTAGRHYIEVQQRMKELANADAIKEQEKALKKFNYEIKTVQYQLKKGTKTITISRGNLPSVTSEIKLSGEEITKYQAQLNNLQISKEATQKSINLLRGIQDGTIQLTQSQRNQVDAYNRLTGASLDYSKALTKEQQAKVDNAGSTNKAIVDIGDLTTKLTKLQAKRDVLAKKAFVNPNAVPQSAIDQINVLDKKIDALTKKIKAVKALAPPASRIESPITPMAPRSISFNIADNITPHLQNASKSLTNFRDTALDVSSTVNGSMQSMAIGIIDSFASLASGTASVGDFFNSILLVVARFMQQLGEAIIATAIASEAFKKLILANPIAAIAAGIALVVASSIVVSKLQRGPGMIEGGVVPAGYPNDRYNAQLTSGEVVIPPKKLEVFLAETAKKQENIQNKNITNSSVSSVFNSILQKMNPPNLVSRMSMALPSQKNMKLSTIPLEVKISGSLRGNGSELLGVIDKATVIRTRIKGN